MISIFTFLSIITTGIFSYAHQPQEGKVFVAAGPFVYQTHAVYSRDQSYLPIQLGLGIIGEADLSDFGGLEAGFFYAHSYYKRVIGGAQLVEKSDRFIIPIGYRRWFGTRVSLGLLFSSAFSVGDVSRVIGESQAALDVTSAGGVTEYSVDASVQGEVWSKGPYAAVIDGRYSYFLSPKPNEDANYYGLFMALKYQIQ